MKKEEVVVRTRWLIGDEVYFKASREPLKGIVLSLVVGQGTEPEYVVRWGDMSVIQHSFKELSNEHHIL